MKHLIYLFIIFSSMAFAKEGMWDQTPKSIYQSSWNNTFMYAAVTENKNNFTLQKHGTVSVLFQKNVGNDVYLGMITAKHVIKDNVGLKTKILKNVHYDTVIDVSDHFQSIGEFTVIDSMVSDNYDLGLLIVKVSLKDARDITTQALTPKCDLKAGIELTIIGFPTVMQRSESLQKIQIPNSDIITKRWSTGQFVNEKISNENGPMVGSTADAMSGMSGGPVLDNKGKLVSIQSAVLDYGAKFNGGNVSAHSFIVDCQVTRNFALKSWDRFQENLEFGDYDKLLK